MTVIDTLFYEILYLPERDKYGESRPTRTLMLEKAGVYGATLSVDVCNGDLVASVDIPVSIIGPLAEALLECQRRIREEEEP